MTKSCISTISYNSESFLKEHLDSWVESHLIQAYMYIKHKGEDGDKDHIHLRIEPNKKLDPMVLTEQLREYVIGNEKPLGVRPWRPSDEENWILYVIHDPDYLKIKYGGGYKGEKIPYKWENIVVSEFYDIETAYIRARQFLENTCANILKQIKEGKTALQLVEEGKDVFRTKACLQTLQLTSFEELIKKNKDMENDLALIRYALINSNLKLDKIWNDDNEFHYELFLIDDKRNVILGNGLSLTISCPYR